MNDEEFINFSFFVTLSACIIVPLIIIFLVQIIKDGARKRREAKFLKFAKKNKLSTRQYFGKFIKDKVI